MLSIKEAVWNTIGFVKFKGKWIPRLYAVKKLEMLAIIALPEAHEEVMEFSAALSLQDKTMGK